jgi:hypothetical protein
MTEGKPAETSEKKTGEDIEAKETPAVLPPDVRAKLRRLDKLESRYHGMHLPNQTVELKAN